MKPKLTIENDSKYWELPNGKFHREDGPALEYASGTKQWCINGDYHREDGPAIEYFDGDKFWYLNNVEYTEMGHKQEMRSRKLEKILK
jgi:hypothetical protein